MAQAQVVITAVDKTQAAINSAMRSMKAMERAAKVTARAVNLAFGFLTGSAIVGAFGKITEAAKKTEEGQKALLELNKALKDPALVAAANAFTNALVSGFAAAIGQAARFIKFIRSEMISLGMIGPQAGASDAAAIIRGQIRSKTVLAGQMGFAGQTKNVQIINDDIRLLQKQLSLVENLAAEEAKRDAARIDAEVRAEAVTTRTVQAQRRAAREIETVREIYAQLDYKMRQTYKEMPELIEASLDLESVGLDKNVQQTMNSLMEKEALYDSFAQNIGASMTDAFAQFLFDPFKNGLDGMLKGFLNVVRQIVAQIAAVEILTAIFAPFAGSSGIGGRIYKSLTARAMGGPVSGGRPYIVGERGPELFVPNSSGGIVPNNRLGMGGGFTLAPVYNIDARGATAELSQALPGILQENNRRIFDELDRRYGIGR